MAESVVGFILKIIAGVAITCVTGYLIPWIKQHSKSQKLNTLLTIGNMVVKAVESEATAGLITTPKKQTAISRLKTWANDVGIQLTDAQINDIVQSAVLALKSTKQTG